MDQFSPKTIYHAHRSGTTGIDQRRIFVQYRQVFVDEKAFIHDVYLNTAEVELAVDKLKLFG